MTAGEWSRVKDLFEATLHQPEPERDSFLAGQSEGAAILDEVRSLLSVYAESPEFLEGAPPHIPAVALEERPAPLEGRRFGAWRLVREIGRGGMGIVWEAQRADDYEQRAAVKLLPASLLSAADIGRFREERQILARLSHPAIARLLDGGTLEDGSPYLVMEYVEGPALDAWCDSRSLGLRDRLQLFLEVCGAVEYAHKRLVVHRDLKPANILVTPDGVPKLLDFGIARLVGPQAAQTCNGARMLTPEYASPEQLQGDVVTTASDIFSLGVLLYFLLTGHKPFGSAGNSPIEIMRAICELDPALPSSVAGSRGGELRGELDAILLQALRKNPDERYHSVRALADDLRSWLEGRPVSAVPQPWWRRSIKFIRRNKTQSAAAALAVISLVAGSAVSLWQAGVASRERERAENRFREVRRFSRSVLFELDDAIRNLPGSTPARNLLLARATEFLDNLARDSSSDAGLKIEVAEGYRRLGHVQGSSFSNNLGHREAAIGSFRKAVRLGEEALAAAPQRAQAGIVLLGAYDDLTNAFINLNDFGQAQPWYDKHRQLLAALDRGYPGDRQVRSAVASSYSALAFYRVQRNDFAGAKHDYRKALDVFAALVAAGHDSSDLTGQYAFALKRLGAILIAESSIEEAERCYRTALKMEDGLANAEPGNATLRIDRTFTLSDLALISKRKKDFEQAARIYAEVVETRRAALAQDAGNVRLLSMTASAEGNLAAVYSTLHRHRESIPLAREALGRRDKALSRNRAFREQWDAAAARVMLAARILDAARDATRNSAAPLDEAAAALRQAKPFVDSVRRAPNPSRSDRGLLADFQEARDSLQILSPQKKIF